LRGETAIGKNCIIGPNTIAENTTVGDDCEILAAVLEGAVVEDRVGIGPFARLRKGAHLCSGVHMGNFGEVKDSTLGPGTKMGHFSYLGNATIGENVNIGAGTITCNYDGVHKNPTEIGDGAFIGSDTMLVAPVKIGARAKTGAGAVVTKDVEADTLVVGVPARPIKKIDPKKDKE
jgi:bifunctional UDP-N-acetylglucosamine pyrophosphorylase/glucosamine-1-phosphate N-acetyltransferase